MDEKRIKTLEEHREQLKIRHKLWGDEIESLRRRLGNKVLEHNAILANIEFTNEEIKRLKC